MRTFLKYFLAALLAIFVFGLIAFFFMMGMAASAVSGRIPKIADKSVLVIDLATKFGDHTNKDFRSILQTETLEEQPGLHDVIRLIKKAAKDDRIRGILLQANQNANGFASGDEIRNALSEFKSSGKFIIAYGENMSQKSYAVANISDKIYLSPKGNLEWFGFSVNYTFIKGTLDRLQINPQIFYAGKFKSATEPFRTEKMTDANRLQTSAWVNDLYADLLMKTAESRKLDTASLHRIANEGVIQKPEDAVTQKLIDGVRYDDQVKDEIKKILKLDQMQKISFVPVQKYFLAHKSPEGTGERIAVIYASGNIVDGKGNPDNIGSATYIDLIRKARMDESIKAIVVRVNSGGGSALASENIWREMSLAKKAKPLMVSFGDVAASGGYYMSCAADSIFALPATLTGSIGVFGIVPDMSTFFKQKLGVTFDGVKTGPLANAGGMDHAMTGQEKAIFQSSVDRFYQQFKERVGEGRKRDTAYIETIAQGRVWAGQQAKEIGLIDRFGGLDDAITAAAKKAGLKEYRIREFPESRSLFESILGYSKSDNTASRIKSDLGEDYYNVYQQIKMIREITGNVQTRLPFEILVR